MRIGVVNEVNGQLQIVKIFDWDRSYDLEYPKVKRKLGLTQAPDRWLDLEERPDVQVGEPFPVKPKPPE